MKIFTSTETEVSSYCKAIEKNKHGVSKSQLDILEFSGGFEQDL